jgi:hypothetical protein
MVATMTRLLIALPFIGVVTGFAPAIRMQPTAKSLAATRREALCKGAAFLVATAFLVAPKSSFAGSLGTNSPIPDNEYVPFQQAKSEKCS